MPNLATLVLVKERVTVFVIERERERMTVFVIEREREIG